MHIPALTMLQCFSPILFLFILHILCSILGISTQPHLVSKIKEYVMNYSFIVREDMIFTCAVFEIFILFIALLFSVI